MNRTRLFVALLAALFLASVGTGVVVGQEDRPSHLTAASADVPTTTTTVARTTTTAAPTTTTTSPEPTTTTAPRPATTVAPATTRPTTATTSPPATDPPTTEATSPPTTIQYNPVQCAEINHQYALVGRYDDPLRVVELKLANCPPFYWE